MLAAGAAWAVSVECQEHHPPQSGWDTGLEVAAIGVASLALLVSFASFWIHYRTLVRRTAAGVDMWIQDDGRALVVANRSDRPVFEVRPSVHLHDLPVDLTKVSVRRIGPKGRSKFPTRHRVADPSDYGIDDLSLRVEFMDSDDRCWQRDERGRLRRRGCPDSGRGRRRLPHRTERR